MESRLSLALESLEAMHNLSEGTGPVAVYVAGRRYQSRPSWK